MNDATSVGMFQRDRHFDQHRHHARVRLTAQATQVTGRQGHRQHRYIVRTNRRIDFQNAVMCHALADGIFTLQRCPGFGLARHLRKQNFQRNLGTAVTI